MTRHAGVWIAVSSIGAVLSIGGCEAGEGSIGFADAGASPISGAPAAGMTGTGGSAGASIGGASVAGASDAGAAGTGFSGAAGGGSSVGGMTNSGGMGGAATAGAGSGGGPAAGGGGMPTGGSGSGGSVGGAGGSSGGSGGHPACPSGGFAWPGGAQAAVSLTYDDSLRSQLDNALPALDRYGLKGTLFLVTGSSELTSQRARYVAALANGHELASHSVKHPCADQLTSYSLASITAELDTSIQALRGLGVVGPMTYAYPCGANSVGQGQSYIPVAKERFTASRGVWGIIADPKTVDLGNTPGIFGSETVTSAELIGRVTEAEGKRGWAIFGFHGIAGDYAKTPQASHDALAEHLASNAARVWTATFGEVARYVAACR